MPDNRGMVLVVEDDPAVAELMSSVVEREGFEVLLAANGADALAAHSNMRRKRRFVFSAHHGQLPRTRRDRSQKPLRATSCGFDSRSRHQVFVFRSIESFYRGAQRGGGLKPIHVWVKLDQATALCRGGPAGGEVPPLASASRLRRTAGISCWEAACWEVRTGPLNTSLA